LPYFNFWPISSFAVSAYRSCMALTRITLSDFRNHADLRLDPGDGFVVLTGENGAGKTNILEALSLLTPGRGLRSVSPSEMARQGGSGAFGVAARLGEDIELGTGTKAQAPDRRLVRINGAQASATTLSEWLSIIWVTPAMDRLFVDTAGERRRFLDRLVLALDPAHARHASRYEAAMRQRNRLLAAEEAADPAWLTAVEAQMATHAEPLSKARAKMATDLAEHLAGQADGPFARAGIALEGWAWVDHFADELRLGRARDASAGRTLSGPHRIDLAVTHLAKGQAASRCSTGEQKALLMGIVLAHADLIADKVNRRPVLLLDEVAAHLDPVRREALFERLSQGGGQVWMTGTETAPFAALTGHMTHFFVSAAGNDQPNDPARGSAPIDLPGLAS
jgi:DNA replication and repair protein RecF